MSTFEPIIGNYIITPLFLLLLVGGLIGVITFFFLLRFRKTPGVKYWLVWQIAASIWAFAYAFEFAATDIETKILWSKFSYFGIVYGPVAFLFFSLSLSSKFKYLQKKYVILIFALASLFVLFPFTNDFHHLHWKSYGINPETNATDYVYGPLFWAMMGFAYFALISGIVNISTLYFRLSGYYKRQVAVLFAASLLPLTGNIIYVFHINPLPGFDWTPFSFLLTGILIAINISQFKMFDLVPFARNKLFEVLPDAILIVDSSHRIADYNPAMKRLIELDDNKLIGKSVYEIFPKWRKMIKQIGEVSDFQTIVSHQVHGKMCYFDLQALTLYDQRKQSNGRLVVWKDITKRVQADEEITESQIRLINEIQEKEQLISDLDSFSHTVAHDLKGMLGAIVSASNMIKFGIDGMSKDELLEINDIIGQSATKTMHITAELLTLASVRQQEIKLVSVNMQNLVLDAMSRLKDMIPAKGAKILLPDDWPEVLGYAAWLEEVWLNYISNAIKYGGTPPVIQIGSDILPGGRVKFWIKDNGKGLSPEDIDLLFTKFTRLDIMRAEGHGLGLSIVKRIIEKLNGEVGVESQNIPGEGSVFYFILPSVKT
jgi:PAS domain S-box-containing protein